MTFIKVVSHPLKKKKQPNWAHWGNDVVDNLAGMGRELPVEETWDTWTLRETGALPVPRTSLGKTYFHKADQVCQPIFDFRQQAPDTVAAEYGERVRVGPRNTVAHFYSTTPRGETGRADNKADEGRGAGHGTSAEEW